MNTKRCVVGLIIFFGGVIISSLQPPIHREVICYNPIFVNLGLVLIIVGFMVIIFSGILKKEEK